MSQIGWWWLWVTTGVFAVLVAVVCCWAIIIILRTEMRVGVEHLRREYDKVELRITALSERMDKLEEKILQSLLHVFSPAKE